MKIGGPSIDPSIQALHTLEPGPTPTPTPKPTPAPTPGPTPTPMPPPASTTMKSAAGTQTGAPSPYCWSEQVGGPSRCYDHKEPQQAQALVVKAGEVVLLKIDADIAPNRESIRPWQGARSEHPSQSIDPALETDLTVDLPKGTWHMDVCATWHGRGDSICWLFKLEMG